MPNAKPRQSIERHDTCMHNVVRHTEVLPAASRPTIKIRISPPSNQRRENNLAIVKPIVNRKRQRESETQAPPPPQQQQQLQGHKQTNKQTSKQQAMLPLKIIKNRHKINPRHP
jgi:hypothetical protein